MKTKYLIIGLVLIFILSLSAWFILRDSEQTLVETVRDVLPFGSGENVNIPTNNDPQVTVGGENQNIFDTETTEAKLLRLSDTPVAGYVALARGTSTIVRFADRATGHIFEVLLKSSGTNNLDKVRLTNETLPKIYEAHFRADGSAVLFRSLENDSDTTENLSLTLTAPRSTSTSTENLYTISATTLRGEIDSVMLGLNNTLYYVVKDSSSIVSSTFTGTGLRTLYTSAFNNWRLSRAGNNLLVYPKASANTSGSAYTLPAGGGSLSKLVGPLSGLTAVANNNGSRLLYSYNEGGLTKLFIKNISTNTSSEVLPATLAEKCVWSNRTTAVLFCGTPIDNVRGFEPDNWYRGRTHFSDYLWQFNSDSEIARLLIDPKAEFNLDLDVSKPTLSPDENFLFFINKTDQTLWGLKLEVL